ncbi:MAG TPA: helix-turn-helix transcriptional regulator [Candidatus Limnocylindria bacterium]
MLTQRQREVLALVRRGRSNREIGADLGISEDGVKAHLSRLYLRYGVTNRVELLNAADESAGQDAELNGRAQLGTLRAIAGRADGRAGELAAAQPDAKQLAAVRDAIVSVDVALDLVAELPAETTGAVIDAVRKRLAAALAELDKVEQAAGKPRTA